MQCLDRIGITSLVLLAACFPTPTPQHAVWHPGRHVEIQGAPLPARAPIRDDNGDEKAGFSWPGLIGGRFGYANRYVRANVGAFFGMTVYGDASLTVRLARLGPVHAAVALEGGVGAAVLVSPQLLGDLVGQDELSGAFTWGRVRPLISIASPHTMDLGGPALTVGASYGTFAGVREVGGSLGVLFLSKLDPNKLFENLDSLTTQVSETVDWSAGSLELNVLWHAELSTASVLLSFSGSFGQRTTDVSYMRFKK